MKPRILSTARLSFPLATALAALLAAQSAHAASGTWGTNAASAWYTVGNWNPNTQFPGLQGNAASNTDIATFTNVATSTSFGINMNATTAFLNLGAISVDSTRSIATTIGNSSTTVVAGQALRLYGATVNSVANTILRNNGTGLLTLQNIQGSGNQFMGVVLGNTTNNINIDNTGGITISSIISEINAGSGITKGGSGAGILTLSGVNTYSGTTTVTAGTLRATTSASALGAGLLSLGGGTLQLADNTGLNFARNTTVTANSTITADRTTSLVNTSVTQTLGTLSIGAQTLNIARGSFITGTGVGGITFGATTLTGAAIFDTAANTNLTLGAVGGNFALTKQGAGTLTLSAASTSTAVTNINAGSVVIQNATSLGTTATNTIVASGGQLFMGTANLSIAEALNLTGTGSTATNGALQFGGSVSGMAVTGAITLGGAARIQGDGNTGATLSGGINLGANALTYNVDGGATHAISTTGITGAGGSLAKSGTGILNLTASNDYTGGTNVNAGTLSFASGSLGTTGNITVNGGTLQWETGNTSDISSRLTLVTAGTASLNTNNQTVAFASGTNNVTSTLTKTGTGTLTMNGNNLHDGLTTVTGGGILTLAGDNSGMTGGVTLDGTTASTRLNINSNTALGTGTLTISGGANGTIANSSGATRTLSTNNAQTWGQNFAVVATNSLDMGTGAVNLGSGTRVVSVSGAIFTVGGVISGAGGIQLGGGIGTMALTNTASTYTGTTVIGNNINDTFLRVTKLANLSQPSSLGAPTTATNGIITIGNSSQPGTLELVGGTTQSVTDRQVRIGGNNNGAGNASIINNNTDAANSLIFTNAAFNLSNATTGSSRSLTLGGSNAGANEIQGAIINNNNNVGVTVNGSGAWRLSGNNTYDGVTTVTGTATLTLSGDNSGAAGGVTLSTATTTNSPRLSLNSATALGTGTFTFGGGSATDTVRLDNTSAGLVNVSTNNVFALNRDFTFIGTQSLNLGNMTTTLGGLTTGTSRNITVTANTLTFGGPIGEAAANLGINKLGAGTLVFSGNNTYTGSTAVSNTGSILNIQHANALGTTAAGTTVANASTLQLQGGISFAAEALSLASHNSSVATARLQNVSGNNTWNGTITSTGTSSLARIFSDADLLTLAGTITGGDANTEFSLQGAGNITVSGQITGPSGLSSNAGATPTTIRRLSNDTNDYTGQTRAVGGVLEFTSVADGGVASALGAGTTTPAINLGSGTSDAVLRYAGTAGGGHTSNRAINLSGTTGAVSIEASGTGALVFNGTNTATGGGSKTLTLGGTNTGDNSISAIVDGSGTTALTKAGAGKWILTGTNSHTGGTLVTAGTLVVNGNISTSNTTVSGTGSTLQGSGTIGGSVTIGNLGTLAPGNSIESLGVASVEFLAGSTYAYELQTNLFAGTPNESADLTYSAGTLDIAATSILTLTDLAASTVLAGGSKLTLISYTGGWTGSELFTYLGGTLNDDSTFFLGANEWLFNYNDTLEGSNYTANSSGTFVTMTVVPEPNVAALLGGLGTLCLLRRRRN